MQLTKDVDLYKELQKAEVRMEKILAELEVTLGLRICNVTVSTFDVSTVSEPRSVHLVKVQVGTD